jgi:hypothetical protein
MRYNKTRLLVLAVISVSLLWACAPVKNSLALQSVDQANAKPSSALQQANQTSPTATVKTQRANLRNKPSRSGKVVMEVAKDDRLVLLGSAPIGPWYNVREDKTGSSGWIHGDVIVLNHGSDQIKSSASQLQRIPTPFPLVPTASSRSYTNVDGVRVPSPVFTDKKPAGATARCGDGSYSFSQHRQGTCSHHGGVAEWL